MLWWRTMLLMTLVGMATPITGAAADPARPNVLIILADDLGYSDLGCYGGEIRTPHLDALAAGGLRFTQFYTTSRCAPTRASLLTGLYPHQVGIGYGTPNWGRPGYTGVLSRDARTIAEWLRPAGYRSFISGKWHVGVERGSWPLDRGFDRFYGNPHGGGHHFRMLPGRHLVLDDKIIEPGPGWFSTTAITDYAVKFIDEALDTGKPFFGYVAYFAPHYPLQALPDDIERYRGKYAAGWRKLREARYRRQQELGIAGDNCPLSPAPDDTAAWESVADKTESDLRMAVYAAMVDEIDQGVGRIVETLRRRGVLDNTLVIFLSDNGACPTGGPLGDADKKRGDASAVTGSPDSYIAYGSSWANLSNTPFRRYKAEVHEGGIITPLIVHWPAGISDPGALRWQAGHVIDLLPTALEAAGVDPKAAGGSSAAARTIEGVSLLPAIAGKPLKNRPLFFEHMGHRAVRDGDWKLVASDGGAWELYDLAKDRTELHDLAAAQPERVKKMARMYDDWARRCQVVPWQKLGKRVGH